MKKIIKYLCYLIYRIGYSENTRIKKKIIMEKYNIHPSVIFFQMNETTIRGDGQITIKENTYANRCMIESGVTSTISIGKWCAIGYNSFILAITHNVNEPTGPEDKRSYTEGDIIIGDYVWIGANVYIREGVKIGNYAVIGANSVVTKDIPDYAVVGGCPAKIIRIKREMAYEY